MKDKELSRFIFVMKGIIAILGILLLGKFVPYIADLLGMINIFLKSTDITNSSPEFKLILFIATAYITCLVVGTVANIIFKLYGLLKEDKNEKF